MVACILMRSRCLSCSLSAGMYIAVLILPCQLTWPSWRAWPLYDLPCNPPYAIMQSGELAQLMEATLAHVGGGPGGPGAGGGLGPPPSSERVVAGWRRFRAVCSEERTEARQVAIQWLHKVREA